jgi:Transglutaminase-like superfamily
MCTPFSRNSERTSWCKRRTTDVLHAIKRYSQLSRNDRWLLTRAYIWLGLIDLGMRLLRPQRLIEIAAGIELPPGTAPGDVMPRARRYARWLESAARHHVVNAHCLHRSLVLHHWLRREGLPSELRIGVRKEGDALKAHAWVELQGEVVNDRRADVARFVPLARLPEKSPASRGPFASRPTFAREGQPAQWQ